MARIVRKRYITLIETLIVIALLSLLAGFIGINVAKAVREQRFRSEVGRVVDTLRTAQDVMLIMDIGTRVKFGTAPDGEGIRLWIETDAPLPEKWAKRLLRQQANLTSIHWIQFTDAEEGSLDISFLSSGIGMTKGLLRLSTSESDDDLGAMTRYICLPGYPKPIFSVENPENDPSCNFEGEEEYAKNLTRYMAEEVQALQEAPQEPPHEEEAPDAP